MNGKEKWVFGRDYAARVDGSADHDIVCDTKMEDVCVGVEVDRSLDTMDSSQGKG